MFGVKTEEYPLARRLFLYNTQKPMSLRAKSLLDFSLSDDAQPIVSEVGFINQEIDTLAYKDQPVLGKALESNKALSDMLKGAERLSTTIRFKAKKAATENQADDNDFELDVKARSDLKRVAKALSNKEQAYLLGFVDSESESAVALSFVEAKLVEQMLKQYLPKDSKVKITAKGYGDAFPVACNSSDTGKAKNRRVEIWVK